MNDFQIISKLGEGAYSTVYKVRRFQDNNIYALKKVKLLNLSEKEKQNALNEVRILASVKSQFVISYKEAFFDEKDSTLCIIMEYADNGDLYQKIVEHKKSAKFFEEIDIWKIFIQLVKGLKALHELNILHRDLKSANVFLCTDGSAKLGDLNVSKVARKGLGYTQTGTPYYASPEVWKDQPYDNKSDIWSLGCVLYEMITLRPPFRAENMEGLYAKVIKGHVNRIPERFSQDLFTVVKILLQVSPEKRPSCEQILKSSIIRERIDYFKEIEGINNDESGDENNLLKTIRIPKNLLFLSDKLPKPNYKKVNVNNKSAVNSKNISNSNFGSIQNNYRSFNKEKEKNKLENKLPPLKINYNMKKKKEFEKEKERILKRIEEKESDSNKEINIEDNNNINNNNNEEKKHSHRNINSIDVNKKTIENNDENNNENNNNENNNENKENINNYNQENIENNKNNNNNEIYNNNENNKDNESEGPKIINIRSKRNIFSPKDKPLNINLNYMKKKKMESENLNNESNILNNNNNNEIEVIKNNLNERSKINSKNQKMKEYKEKIKNSYDYLQYNNIYNKNKLKTDLPNLEINSYLNKNNNNIYYNNSNTIYVSSSSRNNKNNNIKNSYNNNTYSLNTGIKKQNLLNNLLSNKNKDFIVKVIKELNKNKNVLYTSNLNNTSHTKKKSKKQNNIISPSEKLIQNQLQFNKTSSSTHHMKTLSSSSSSAGQGLITSYHNKNTLSMSKLQIASNIQSSYQKNKKSKDKKNENIIKALNIKENIPYTSRESKNSFSPELMQMLNSKIRKIKNLSSNKRISMSISSKKPLIQNTSYGNNKEKQKEYKTINSDLNRNKNTRNKKYDNTTDSLSIGINNKYLSPENKSEKDNNNISKSPPKSPDYNKIMKTYAHFHSKSTFLGNTNNEKLKMKKIKNSVFSNKPELNIKGFQIKGFKQLLQNNTNSNNNSKHSKGSNSDRLLFSESSYKTISKTNRSNSKTFLDMYSILNKK